jgi:AcrR family transcriptional regulator
VHDDSELLLRDRKKAQTRRALIEQAIRLFDEQGFEATTVEEIAAAAGFSERSFFRHFSSKEDVVFHDLPARLDDLRQQLAIVPDDQPPWPAVRDAMRRMTRQYTDEDPALTEARIRLWMTEPRLYLRWAEIALAWEQVIAEFIVTRRAGVDGFGSDIGAEVIAAAVVAALRAAWRTEVLHGGSFDDLVGQALELLDRGLGDERLS